MSTLAASWPRIPSSEYSDSVKDASSMPGVAASGRSSYATVVDCDATVGLSSDPAGLDDRDR
eukprot:1894418-Pyramimonas_sp.AAC.1